MISYPLLIPLLFRSLTLLLPQTYFQPDEFYQSLEPAHRLIYGYGYLTWEWRDLPRPGLFGEQGGRMRGWLWPLVFAGVYKLLQMTGMDQTFLFTFAPRVVGVLVAAFTDYQTYRLANKVLGSGAGPAALFLSMTSLFNAHLLPRALSTSPETLLTVAALTYFPFPVSGDPTELVVNQGGKGIHVSPSMKDVTLVEGKGTAGQVLELDNLADLDYVMMDRMQDGHESVTTKDNLVLSMALAALAICIRPTTIPFWSYMGFDLVWRQSKKSYLSGIWVVVKAVMTGLVVLAASTCIDYQVTGQITFPILTFIDQNLVRNVSSYYGATTPLYHLTQSLPILLFPLWYYFLQGFSASLLPAVMTPQLLRNLDRPAGLRLLARALPFTITVLSFSPHSEWRFLHPLLPALLLFALPPLFRAYQPAITGAYYIRTAFRQYLRLPSFPFYLFVLAPVLPFLYLNIFHGRGQVAVMDLLRKGELGSIDSLVVLAPCHSFPWMSGLHRNVDGWFLTCEPPLCDDPMKHQTQQSIFYADPVRYLDSSFPRPPVASDCVTLRLVDGHVVPYEMPSHVVFFGELLDRTGRSQDDRNVRSSLTRLGYSEKTSLWNGFDLLQDEEERRGGVRVWVRRA